MDIKSEAHSLQPKIVAWRRQLHRIPELGLRLPKTKAFVCAALDQMGISYQLLKECDGIVVIMGKPGGKVVALRGDMDGLPIHETANVSFRSENDNMHACGHDAHTAMLLGCAKLFKAHEAELPGQVKLLFQPAEEGPGGAEVMVHEGVLQNPRPDYFLATHVMPTGIMTDDQIAATKTFGMWAADDQIELTIEGCSAHGSTPDKAVDAIVVAAQVILAVQNIISREVSPLTPSVISFGSMTAGRGAGNIIADKAVLYGTIRNVDPDTRIFVLRRIPEICEGVCSAMRAKCSVRYYDSYPAAVNDPVVVERFICSAQKILEPGQLATLKEPMMGGEDAAFFMQEIPGCYFFLNVAQKGNPVAMHTSDFAIDESHLSTGTALMAQCALDLMES